MLLLQVGLKATGKTFYCKKILKRISKSKKKLAFIFDINSEYNEYPIVEIGEMSEKKRGVYRIVPSGSDSPKEIQKKLINTYKQIRPNVNLFVIEESVNMYPTTLKDFRLFLFHGQYSPNALIILNSQSYSILTDNINIKRFARFINVYKNYRSIDKYREFKDTVQIKTAELIIADHKSILMCCCDTATGNITLFNKNLNPIK